MTTPNLPWATTDPADLPQGVIPPSQLGSSLQDHSQTKYTNLAGSRFPGIAKGTAAGSPTNPGGPIGFVTGVFSRIVSKVATADPATINSPDDIVAQAGGFFGGLPLLQTAVIEPLSHLLSFLFGGDPDDWDSVDEIRSAFFNWGDKIRTDLLSVFGLARKAQDTANSIGAQAYYLGQNQSANAGKGTWQGVDGTAEVSLPLSALAGATLPTLTVTASSSRAGVVRMDSSLPKQSVVFLAYKTGTVTSFILDVYRMDIDTGALTRVQTTPNAAGNLATAVAWQEVVIDPGISVDVNTVLVVKFRMVGSGSVIVGGAKMPIPIMLPGVFPRGTGFVFSGNDQVESYTDAQLQSAYTGDTPYFGMGLEGRSNDLPRYFFDDFNNRTAFGPLWAITDRVGSTGPTISGGAVAFVGNSDGTEGITYVQPMLGDRIRVGWDVTNANGYTASGVTMHATSDQTANALIIGNFANSVRLGVGKKASDAQAVTVKEVAVEGNGHFECEYTPADNTYRFYREGSTVPFTTWTDTNNQIPHGDGHRFCGVWVSRAAFFNSGTVDNWSAADIEN